MSLPVRWLIELASRWQRAARRRAFLDAMRKRRAVAAAIDNELRDHLVAIRGRWQVSHVGFDWIVWTRSHRCHHVLIRDRYASPSSAISMAALLHAFDAQGATP